LAYLSVLFAGFKLFALKNWPPVSMQTLELILIYTEYSTLCLNYLMYTNLIASFVFALLPHQLPYRLALDRTIWKFGTANINVLVFAVVYKGVAFPILFKIMPKFGNSSTSERIELMQSYIELFGIETIECLLTDRESIGNHWLKYLNFNKIRYRIRIRENFWGIIPKNGHLVKVSWLFNHLKIIQYEFYYGIVYVNGKAWEKSPNYSNTD